MRCLGCSRRGHADGLQGSQEGPDRKAAHQTQSQSGEEFPAIAGTRNVAYQRGIPWYRVGPLCEIFFVFYNETCGLDGLESGCSCHHVRNAIAALNSMTDGTIMREGVVVLVRHDPFVEPKGATWLQYAIDLRVNGLERRGVDGGLDCVDGVKGVFRKIDILSRVLSALSAANR